MKTLKNPIVLTLPAVHSHDRIAFVEAVGAFIMKEIQLNKGKFALVDDEDFEYLNQFNWYAAKRKYTFYAVRNPKTKGHLGIDRLHRLIINKLLPTDIIDHIDGNGLNNQKNNLRICTKSQNAMNSHSHCNSVSGFKGVHFNKDFKKYRVSIFCNGKNMFLGYFNDEKDAAKAYDKAAKEYFGEFARLNFNN